ncbi:MAG: hypothetical protein ACI3VE_01600 [Oscillospiraceae bacterium]
MKKLGIIILALALLCTCLAGCGKGNVDNGNDGYIGDNTHDNNDGNVPDNGDNGDRGDNDILDFDDDDNMDGNNNTVPTAVPNSSPAITTQPITP